MMLLLQFTKWLTISNVKMKMARIILCLFVAGGIAVPCLLGCTPSRTETNDPVHIRQKITLKVQELATLDLEKLNVQEKMYSTQLRNEIETSHPFSPSYYFKGYKEYKSWQLLDIKQQPNSLLRPYYASVEFTYDQYGTEHIYDFGEGKGAETAEKDNKFKLTHAEQAEVHTYWFDYDGELREGDSTAPPEEMAVPSASHREEKFRKIEAPVGSVVVPDFASATPAPQATLPPPPEVRTPAPAAVPPMVDAPAAPPLAGGPAMKPAGPGPISPIPPEALKFMQERGITFGNTPSKGQ